MINREELMKEVMLEVQEIRNHPDRIWSSKDRNLAVQVCMEIKKEYPEAVLCDAWWGAFWIPLNETQREELRDMLEDVLENQKGEIGRLELALAQLRVTEKEKLEAWLARKIKEQDRLCVGRDYSETIKGCIDGEKCFQLYKGIDEAAAVLGKEIRQERRRGKIRKSFRFRDCEILQLEDCDD